MDCVAARIGRQRLIEQLGQSKVTDFHRVADHKQILWLNVTMNDPLIIEIVDPLRRLAQILKQSAGRDAREAASATFTQFVRQRAVGQLHREDEIVAPLPRAEYRRQVSMADIFEML